MIAISSIGCVCQLVGRISVDVDIDFSDIYTAIDGEQDLYLIGLNNVCCPLDPDIGFGKVNKCHGCSNISVYVAIIKIIWHLIINALFAYVVFITRFDGSQQSSTIECCRRV